MKRKSKRKGEREPTEIKREKRETEMLGRD